MSLILHGIFQHAENRLAITKLMEMVKSKSMLNWFEYEYHLTIDKSIKLNGINNLFISNRNFRTNLHSENYKQIVISSKITNNRINELLSQNFKSGLSEYTTFSLLRKSIWEHTQKYWLDLTLQYEPTQEYLIGVLSVLDNKNNPINTI